MTCFKDYYKVLEVDYDATDEKIRLNYRRLALVSLYSFAFSFYHETGFCFTLLDCEYSFILWYDWHVDWGNFHDSAACICRSGILTSTRVIAMWHQSFKRSTKLTKVILVVKRVRVHHSPCTWELGWKTLYRIQFIAETNSSYILYLKGISILPKWKKRDHKHDIETLEG